MEEPIAVTSQKHDPAWKHCQMFKNGDKVHLKCIYCGKIFKGGGIHRIKEHLAGQKGNAATCLRVQPDVRLQMLESLNGVAVKKRKKQKLAEEISGYDNPTETANNGGALPTEVVLLPVAETAEHDHDVFVNREDASSRKKKGRVRKAPDSTYLYPPAPPTNNSRKISSAVNMAVGRFFNHVGLPPDAVTSPYFQPMLDAIAAQGLGVVGPTYHDLQGLVLRNLVHEARGEVDRCASVWGRTGCSILAVEQSSSGGKACVSLFAYCPDGTVFLRSADLSHTPDSDDLIFDLLRSAVEEVGSRNVLQVVTGSDEKYILAGKRLAEVYPTLFWTPCVGGCIDQMLDDISQIPSVGAVLEQAKSVSRYVYSYGPVLNMMRRYTFGVDLVDLGSTRPATDFMTLRRMVGVRHNLQSMVTSDEWMESPYSKNPGGFSVLDTISSQSFWSACSSITRLVDPILRLLRIANSGKRPAMGYVYAGLYRAKEAIKKELVAKEEYLVYWDIIDRRWELLQGHPLHAAGFYLNPKFFYSLEGDAHFHIRSLVYDCIEKLVPDPTVQDKIMKETAAYHGGAGDFGRKMAIRARDTLLPAEWWQTYGGGCPNLARLAIRILSQTCCLIHHKIDKIPIDRMQERINCLEHQRLSDLVFVQFNLSMKQIAAGSKQHEAVDPISYEHNNLVEDWVVDKHLCSEGSENTEWMALDPPLGNVMLLGPQLDDHEALGAGFDDYEIFYRPKDGEEMGEDKIHDPIGFPPKSPMIKAEEEDMDRS